MAEDPGQTEFAWPPPSAGSFQPDMLDPSEAVGRDARAIEWFLRRKGHIRVIDPTRPIARWIRNLDAWSHGTRLENVPHGAGAILDFAPIADAYGARLLAWAIRALCTRPPGTVEIDASFVANELHGADHTTLSHFPTMPGGLRTLYFAARAVHLVGGLVRIVGDRSKAPRDGRRPDIIWQPRPGLTVVFEMKERAFYRAAAQSPEQLARDLAHKCFEATSQLSSYQDAVRVAVAAATTNFEVSQRLAPALVPAVHAVYRDKLRSTHASQLPHVALVHVLGFGHAEGHALPTMFIRAAVLEEAGGPERRAFFYLYDAFGPPSER